MSREELKRLWWSLPHPKVKEEMRVIKVHKIGTNHYECKKITDVVGYYSTFSSSYNTLNEALDFARKLMKEDSKYSIVLH